MSKLAKCIDYTITGDVRAARNMKLNYLDVKFETAPVNQHQGGTVRGVKIEAKLTAQKWFHDEVLQNPDIRSEIIKDVKLAMIEEVFGEFRPYLIEMRSALYNEDTSRIRSLIAELEEKMFADGI